MDEFLLNKHYHKAPLYDLIEFNFIWISLYWQVSLLDRWDRYIVVIHSGRWKTGRLGIKSTRWDTNQPKSVTVLQVNDLHCWRTFGQKPNEVNWSVSNWRHMIHIRNKYYMFGLLPRVNWIWISQWRHYLSTNDWKIILVQIYLLEINFTPYEIARQLAVQKFSSLNVFPQQIFNCGITCCNSTYFYIIKV